MWNFFFFYRHKYLQPPITNCRSLSEKLVNTAADASGPQISKIHTPLILFWSQTLIQNPHNMFPQLNFSKVQIFRNTAVVCSEDIQHYRRKRTCVSSADAKLKLNEYNLPHSVFEFKTCSASMESHPDESSICRGNWHNRNWNKFNTVLTNL